MNLQIIHILEENHVEPADKSYEKCLIEAIICHHNEIADYILVNYIDNDLKEIYEKDSIKSQIFISYNYYYFPDETHFQQENNRSTFYYLCKRDYFNLLTKILDGNLMNDVEFQISMKTNDKGTISTPFLSAVESDYTSIAELLLKRPEINVNSLCVEYVLDKAEHKHSALE